MFINSISALLLIIISDDVLFLFEYIVPFLTQTNFQPHFLALVLAFHNITKILVKKNFIRELWHRWQQLFPMFYNCPENVTINEQFVAFRGRCSFRQYMPSTPEKHDLKFWLSVDSKSTRYIGLDRRLERAIYNRRQFFSTFDLVKNFRKEILDM